MFLELLLPRGWCTRLYSGAMCCWAKVHVNGEDKVCKECFALGNQQRLLSKVSSFVHSLDEARLLHTMMFESEKVDDLKGELGIEGP